LTVLAFLSLIAADLRASWLMVVTGVSVPVVFLPFAGRFGELSQAEARRVGRAGRC
jgi:hypothetical protein